MKSNQKTTTITVKAREEFTITLPSNPTTGYHWGLATSLPGGVLLLLGNEYRPEQARRRGSGGEEKWIFRGLKRGSARLVFRYTRSWERDHPPLREKVFRINCR